MDIEKVRQLSKRIHVKALRRSHDFTTGRHACNLYVAIWGCDSSADAFPINLDLATHKRDRLAIQEQLGLLNLN